jgi:hypothetical protein
MVMFVFAICAMAAAGEDDSPAGNVVAFEFPPKNVRWVMFTVEKVNKDGCHVGLSEIAVF